MNDEKPKRLNPNIVNEIHEDYIYLELSKEELNGNAIRDIVLDLLSRNKRLNDDNYHLKRQLIKGNDEIKSLRKGIERLKKQVQSKRKERYKNNKR